MLDVGACHGATAIPFATEGWDVHAFEPDSTNREVLEAAVAYIPLVTIVPKAVADHPGTLTLYRSDESVGISSLAPFTDSHSAAHVVEVVTLTDYLADASVGSVDFLKIDVEGFEREVLGGFPWNSYTPDAIVLEFEDLKTVPRGYSWTDLADGLVEHGYGVMVSEWAPIERYGVAHKWLRFIDYPTHLSDERAWGNLIAVRPHLYRQLERESRRVERIFRLRSILPRIAQRLRGDRRA
jgi:FkbM family methyltransferase